MDVERVRNYFKLFSDKQLQWYKEQYEFDVSLDKEYPEERKSGAEAFLNLINEEIYNRNSN